MSSVPAYTPSIACLDRSATFFRQGDFSAGMREFSRANPDDQNRVYFELWAIKGRIEAVPEYGRHSFHNVSGRFSTLEEKANAINAYVPRALLEQNRHTAPPRVINSEQTSILPEVVTIPPSVIRAVETPISPEIVTMAIQQVQSPQLIQEDALNQARARSVGGSAVLYSVAGGAAFGPPGMVVSGLIALIASFSVRVIKESNRGQCEIQMGLQEIQLLHYPNAFVHFENAALLLTGTNKVAECIRYLGICREYGDSACRDFTEAALHYRRAIERGYEQAQGDLERLYSSPALKCQDALTIGVMYYHGNHNGKDVKKDYTRSKCWYDKAIEIGAGTINAAIAIGNTGLLYEYATDGTGDNLITAAEFYMKSVSAGNDSPNLSRLLNRDDININIRKKIESKYMCWLHESRAIVDDCLNVRDSQGQTPLIRAVKFGLIEQAARIIYFSGPTGGLFSDDADNVRLTAVSKKLRKLYAGLRKPVDEVIRQQIDVMNLPEGVITERWDALSLPALCRIPLLAPIMKLTKLAALGCHRLSRPGRSQDEDMESSLEGVPLTISIDPNENHAGRMAFYGSQGREGERAGGVYLGDNTVYVGARDHFQNTEAGTRWLRGTVVHELAHFIAKEIFGNECVPYSANDTINCMRFNGISDSLKVRALLPNPRLDPVILDVFTHPIYNQPSYSPEWQRIIHHRELIVRISELIARDPGQAGATIDRLRGDVPELLSYYEDVFLPAVNAHINELIEKALGGWPREWFISGVD